MAKAKRANHSGGTEGPPWPVRGTAEEPAGAGWDTREPPDHHATGTNGHGPHGQIGPNGLQAHTQSQNDPSSQNGHTNGQPAGDGPVPNGQPGGQTAWTLQNPTAGNGTTAENGHAEQTPAEPRPGDAGADGEKPPAGSNGVSDGGAEPVGEDGPRAGGIGGVVSTGTDQAQDAAARADNGRGGAPGDNGRAGSTAAERKQDDAAKAGSGRAANGSVAAGRDAGGSAAKGGSARTRKPKTEPGAWRNELRPPREQRPAGFGAPVRVDEIAVAAKALSDDLVAATQGLSESIESRQYRRELDDAADTIRAIADELESTASRLIRLAAAEGQICDAAWGICPEHGLTLVSSVGETSECRVLGCHRPPEGLVERCTQPVAYKVVDVAGPALHTCAGHALACRLHLDGAVITLASDSLELF